MAHPWASGATAWLSAQLGVRPLEPGYRRWSASPTLLDFGRFSALGGAVPTPHGPISLSVDYATGALNITVPPGTRAVSVVLPTRGARVASVRGVEGAHPFTVRRGDTLDLGAFAAGTHRLRLDFDEVHAASALAQEGGPWDPSTPPAPSEFVAEAVSVDRSGGGQWRGRYGRAGHVLFAYAHGEDVSSLPPQIRGVYAAGNPGNTGERPYPVPGRKLCTQGSAYACNIWGRTTADPRAPEPPATGGQQRAIGGVSSRRWASFHVDVAASEGHRYNITFYCVDFDGAHIREAIKVHRGDMGVAAPMVLLEDFDSGVYVTYTIAGPARFRFLQVPSAEGLLNGFPPRPVVSAVFFDAP